MIPVPPPEILELGTAVADAPLNVTLRTLALVAVVFSHATPIITILSVPPPSVWDQVNDEIAVVDAVRLAASKEIAPKAGSGRTHSAMANTMAETKMDRTNLRGGIAICPFANTDRPPY